MRIGQSAEAKRYYDDYLKIKKLKSDRDVRIEMAYVKLLDAKYDDAAVDFEAQAAQPLSGQQQEAVQRGAALANGNRLPPTGTELDDVRLTLDTVANSDKVIRISATAAWDSSLVNLEAVVHRFSSPNFVDRKNARGNSFGAQKSVPFSLGPVLDLSASYFDAGKGLFN